MTAAVVPTPLPTRTRAQRPDHVRPTRRPWPRGAARRQTEPLPILATDLDGTLAAGPDTARRRLARALRRDDGPELVYATDLPYTHADALRQAADLPPADVWVTDGGCRVESGRYGGVLTPLDLELDEAWPGTETVREHLEALRTRVAEVHRGSRRRIDLRIRHGHRAEDVIPAVEHAVRGHALRVRHYADGTVSILPEGIERGSTLLRVLTWIGRDRTVVLGGTLLHEVPLLRSHLPGFALPDAHPVVRRIVRQRPNLYLARRSGAVGMADGMHHFALLARRSILN